MEDKNTKKVPGRSDSAGRSGETPARLQQSGLDRASNPPDSPDEADGTPGIAGINKPEMPARDVFDRPEKAPNPLNEPSRHAGNRPAEPTPQRSPDEGQLPGRDRSRIEDVPGNDANPDSPEPGQSARQDEHGDDFDGETDEFEDLDENEDDEDSDDTAPRQ